MTNVNQVEDLSNNESAFDPESRSEQTHFILI